MNISSLQQAVKDALVVNYLTNKIAKTIDGVLCWA